MGVLKQIQFFFIFAILISIVSIDKTFAKKPLFKDKTPIQAVLSAPLSQAYVQRKKKVRLYLDSTLTYKENEQNQKLAVKIRTRGNFRRLNCAHPPLHLNFAKKKNNNTLFEKQNKLKLVGQCRNGKAYQDYLGLEYLAYQIWQEVSDYHFKTRLVELSYVDTNGKKKPWSTNTFLIEDVDELAKRYKRKVLDVEKIKRQQLDLAQTALLELFQLFIGNTDYSTLTSPAGKICCHNTRLIADKDPAIKVIPIPYDFDVSGFVNAPYATPSDLYPIKRVRERYFSGWCKEDKHYANSIQRFNDSKANVVKLVSSSDLLSQRSISQTTKYIDSFYALINDDARVKKEILGRCRGKVIKG